MPRNTLSRRSMLQMTSGAALAAPLALVPAGAVVADAAAPDRTLAPQPVRRIAGVLVAFDESPAPSTLHPSTGCKLTIDIAEDGGSVLTLGHYDGTPDATIALPDDVARELDRVLFYVERDSERRIREKREVGWIDCPLCSSRYPCRDKVCDEDRLVHPDSITRHLGPWLTEREVRAELHRVPAGWGAVELPSPYWVGDYVERLAGTSEDGRIETIEVQLHGLGWGTYPVDEGDLPDGPSITLWPRDGTHHHPETDLPIEWCAYLVGDPVHGGADTVGEALDQAVASIERRLADPLAVSA